MWKEAARPCDRAKRADRKEALNEDNSSNQRVAIAAVALSLAQLPPFPNKLAVNHVLLPVLTPNAACSGPATASTPCPALPTVASSHHEPDHRLSKPASTVGHGGLW